ncbi:MAG: sigma 54-interacting transcriptional regulator [Myxococcales bacterium]|nr:sigma 54-interacting transcriptional regulator [Myxococcales bacterium]
MAHPDDREPGNEPRGRPSRSTTVSRAIISDERHILLVVGKTSQSTHALPASGRVTIGRAAENDIAIDDASISRHHATLILDAPIRIVDNDSANGTWIGDRQVPVGEEITMHTNDPLRIGNVLIVLQTWSTNSRPRRLKTHEYFEARLEEEAMRGARRGDAFGVLFAHVESGATDPLALFSLCLRETDLVAEYAPGQYEILVVDTTPSGESTVISRVETAASENGLDIRLGAAWFPRDGRDASALMTQARVRADEHAIKPLPSSDHAEPKRQASQAGLVVSAPSMRALHSLIERVAASDISVLLLGETGVGKEMIAAEIHKKSTRADKPYIPLNCSALTETLLESELFGYERGAFTGANTAKQGLLETANGGVLFLDEIGELPLSTQVKLLRVLDERRVTRVGGIASKPIDVRIVSATNRDVDAEVIRGTFRSDLLYRLNAMTVQVPPLRERHAEIEPLTRHFINHFATRMNKEVPILSEEALALCYQYYWPGNVRELRNVMERAVVLCKGKIIMKHDLPVERMMAKFADARATLRPSVAPPMPQPSYGAPSFGGATPQSAAFGASIDSSTPGPYPLPALGSAQFAPSRPDQPTYGAPAYPPASRAATAASEDETMHSWRGRAWDRAEIEATLVACGGNQAEAAKRLGVSRRTLINRLEKLGIARPRKRP